LIDLETSKSTTNIINKIKSNNNHWKYVSKI
jgi:hypothetical protein